MQMQVGNGLSSRLAVVDTNVVACRREFLFQFGASSIEQFEHCQTLICGSREK